MTVRATRWSGGLLASVGVVFCTFFLRTAITSWGPSSPPSYWLVQAYPIALSLALASVGVELARGRLVADRYLRRLLSWMVIGVAVFVLLSFWFYGFAVLIRGRTLLRSPVGVLTLPVLGALVGSLVGTYDARGLEGKRAVQRLSRINETLRIATGELVEQSDRGELEHAVCRRLVDADFLNAAWVGRYDAEDGDVRPAAWAGFDDDVASLAVPVDGEKEGGSVWSRVVDTETGQLVQNVLIDEGVGPWAEAFDRNGVESITVVPVVGTDSVHGLICICADRPSAFDERQREVLAELGEAVGHAVDSIRAHEALEVRERELLEQNDRLDEFAGVVSHDLRNPLNVILARVEMLDECGEREHLDAIERSGNRMAEIITDLLALSRASRAAVDVESVSLATAAAEGWRTVETDGVELDLQVLDTTTIRADPARLRTVFENLFRNASEHNGTPLTIRVGVSGADGGESATGFFVGDDGEGVPIDERDDIFDHGYTTNADGTGFGLSIVRGAADAHGWRISVGEGPEGGAHFEITGVEFAD